MNGRRLTGSSVGKGISFLIAATFALQTVSAPVLAATPAAAASSSQSATAATQISTAAARTMMLQGKAEMAAGRLDKAIDLLSKAAKAFGTEPGSCECHFCLGRALCEKAKQQKASKNQDSQKNFLAARRELRSAIRVGRGNDISKKANAYMMANLPPSLTKPRTGEGTEMIAARLGLHGQDRGAGGIAKAQVLEFYATWCQPCKDLKPVLAKVKQQYGDQIEIKSFNVDDDSAQDVIDQYEVSPIPTIIFLNPDSKVVGYSIGYTGETPVQKQLQKILMANADVAKAPALPATSAPANPAAAADNDSAAANAPVKQTSSVKSSAGNSAATAKTQLTPSAPVSTNAAGTTKAPVSSATSASITQPKQTANAASKAGSKSSLPPQAVPAADGDAGAANAAAGTVPTSAKLTGDAATSPRASSAVRANGSEKHKTATPSVADDHNANARANTDSLTAVKAAQVHKPAHKQALAVKPASLQNSGNATKAQALPVKYAVYTDKDKTTDVTAASEEPGLVKTVPPVRHRHHRLRNLNHNGSTAANQSQSSLSPGSIATTAAVTKSVVRNTRSVQPTAGVGGGAATSTGQPQTQTSSGSTTSVNVNRHLRKSVPASSTTPAAGQSDNPGSTGLPKTSTKG